MAIPVLANIGIDMVDIQFFKWEWDKHEYIPTHLYVEAMSSKVILMMPKKQESSNSRCKNQASRIKIQDSRFKKQGKAQSR